MVSVLSHGFFAAVLAFWFGTNRIMEVGGGPFTKAR
jgi:hypothetical protein